MDQERENALLLKVALIPEEETRGKWVIEPEDFTGEGAPLPVTEPVTAEGSLYRAGVTVYLSGTVKAVLGLECSRCLKSFSHTVEAPVSVVFMPEQPGGATGGQDSRAEAEDADIQSYDGDKINLKPPFFDQVALDIPIQPLCSEGCKGLCPVCGADLNEGECGCDREDIDPRFAVLKKLKKDKENPDAGT